MTPDKKKIQQSLKASLWDGIFASGMTGFTQDFFVPFLLVLGGTAKHVGILSSLPNFTAALVQLKSADFAEKAGSRKKIITVFVLLQALMLIPVASLAWQGVKAPMVFIAMITCFTAFGAFATPPWGSLMSDLIGEKCRGEYFGWRNRVLGVITIGVSLLAGVILHRMKGVNVYYGFTFIFMAASASRLVSWYFLHRMYEPELVHKKEDYFNFFMFIRRVRQSNFAKFVVFVAMLNFTVNMASPFFAVLMLRDLHFSYLTYTMVTLTATLTIYLLMSRWGQHADKVGNLRVMKFTAPIVAVLPSLWVICREPAYLMGVQVVAGFAWAGFNLCATNFIYDAVTPQKRIRCIAYFNVVNGLALCGGALLGGFLVEHLPPLWGYKIFTLLLMSSALRMLVALSIPMMIKEVRPVQKISSRNLFFSMVGMRPILGIDRKTIKYEG